MDTCEQGVCAFDGQEEWQIMLRHLPTDDILLLLSDVVCRFALSFKLDILLVLCDSWRVVVAPNDVRLCASTFSLGSLWVKMGSSHLLLLLRVFFSMHGVTKDVDSLFY